MLGIRIRTIESAGESIWNCDGRKHSPAGSEHENEMTA